jgi:serine O-acetyltransferase
MLGAVRARWYSESDRVRTSATTNNGCCRKRLNGAKGVDQLVDRISADVPDWTREMPRQFWDPGRKLLLALRHYQIWQQRSGVTAVFFRRLVILRHRLWSVVTGADIPLNCQIGGGLLIPHPNGIVIHPEAKIGVNCLIFQQVTIGTRDGAGAPRVGGHVDIGAGAKVLGDIEIGPHARIGANAVIVKNVEGGGTAVGWPC